MERRAIIEMEVTHLRDTVNARDTVIEEMRGKIKEY